MSRSFSLAYARHAMLDTQALEERAEYEIGRARRYQRPLLVMVLRLDSADEQRLVGAMSRRVLRRWDIVGLGDSDPPTIVMLFPETGIAGIASVCTRLGELLPSVPMGVASFPDDGMNWQTLYSTAFHRATMVGLGAPPHPQLERVE